MIAKITVGRSTLKTRADLMNIEVDWNGQGDEHFDVYVKEQKDGSLSVLGNTLAGQLFLSLLVVGTG